MEDNYKNREIDSMFQELHQKMDHNKEDTDSKLLTLHDDMQKIDAKVSYTNGSVAKIQTKMVFMQGVVWTIGGIVTLIGIPLGIFYIEQTLAQSDVHQQVQMAVDDALSHYNINSK